MKEKPQDEIDLIELLARFIRMLRRNIVLISISVAVCLAISIWALVTLPKVYESRMIIYSDILTESYCDQLAMNLNALVQDRNFELLAERLKISEDQAATLRNVEMEGVLEGAATEAERLVIVVEVRLVDNSVLPDLQEGIVQYMTEKDFVKTRTEEKRRFYQELIARVGQEIEKLEVVKQKITDGDYRQVSGMVMVNPADVYAQTVELFKNKLMLEEELRLVSSVQLVEGFSPLNRPVSPKLSILLPAGLVAGLLVAFLIIGLRYALTLAPGDV